MDGSKCSKICFYGDLNHGRWLQRETYYKSGHALHYSIIIGGLLSYGNQTYCVAKQLADPYSGVSYFSCWTLMSLSQKQGFVGEMHTIGKANTFRKISIYPYHDRQVYNNCSDKSDLCTGTFYIYIRLYFPSHFWINYNNASLSCAFKQILFITFYV